MRRLLVADSQGFYRSGLRAAVEAAIPSLEVVEAQSYEAMFAILDQRPIDVVLVDPQLAGVTSLDTLKILRALYPCVRFALLSAAGRQHDVFKILAAGFSGFIFKSQGEEEIIGAISDILSGRVYIPPVREEYPAAGAPGLGAAPARPALEAPAYGGTQKAFQEIDKLTPRQREVLALIAEGLPNKEIARRLNISEATTKIHAGALMRVLGVKNRTEAALLVQSLCVKLEEGEAAFERGGRYALIRRP
ncbi:LuxR C-terminal-related transcriptional regulator [Methylobacterium symbioticum]|uniref:Nitrate/nitrite response regulator protein NarL n=1 Tax=Methylobacterium symbioticum TaxID=2584084 RepID=A0A509ECM6_9HYPH|nr:response regulator transcription factor [Methylobacterium symbioticum]VUD72026.1 Nitrate/nitrite response regulator protein NarL [Methylobacterium symbioticum]